MAQLNDYQLAKELAASLKLYENKVVKPAKSDVLRKYLRDVGKKADEAIAFGCYLLENGKVLVTRVK